MKKISIIIFSVLMALNAHGETQVAVGLGQPYGGYFGGRFCAVFDHTKVYVGGGLLSYTGRDGVLLGYNVGVDYQISSSNNSLGLSYGTVSSAGDNKYIGTSVNYVYYFSGFNSESWMLGLSLYEGKLQDNEVFGYKNSVSGQLINIGFQY